MQKVWYVILGSTLLFVFLYSWYLPVNNLRQLVLNLPANGIGKSIAVTNDAKIDQEITLQQSVNSIELSVHGGQSGGAGTVHLTILKDNKVITKQDQPVSQDVVFALPGAGISGDVVLEYTFSGIEKDSNLTIATAFGKYANLSGMVRQYVLQDSSWKVTDARHGNVELSLYNNPPKNHVFAALQIFALPALLLIAIGLWGIRILNAMKPVSDDGLKVGWREYASIAAIGILLAVIATAPIFIHPSSISNHGDINRGLVYNVIAQRDIIMGHLPQWNQYICGGSPLVGDLESWFLHPLFFLTLPFSEVIAMKLTYLLVLASVFSGFYIFARIILRFQIKGSSLFAIIMAFGGYLSAHLAEGYYVWTASAYIPWFLLFAMLALRNVKFIPFAGLMLAFMFGAGSMHLVVYSMLFIALVWMFPAYNRKFSERATVFFAIAAFFVVLSAVKLLPAFSVLTANSSREGFAPFIQTLPAMLFGRGALSPLTHAGQLIRWGEFDGYIGIVTGVVALVGTVIFRSHVFKQYKAFLIASVVMGIISFMQLPITHGFISHIFDLFRMPSRVLWFGIFGIALIVGYTIDTSKHKSVMWVLIGLIACDLISNDITLFSRTFTVPVPELHAETNFKRVSHAYTSSDEMYYRAVYLDFLENRGTNDVCRFYQAGPFTRSIDETDPRYISQGEVYLKDVSAGTLSYSMNNRSEYVIHTKILSSTSIVINQNYYPGWVTDSGQVVENSDGLISIPIAPGTHDVTFKYRPHTVSWGIVLSLLGCLLGASFWLHIFKKYIL